MKCCQTKTLLYNIDKLAEALAKSISLQMAAGGAHAFKNWDDVFSSVGLKNEIILQKMVKEYFRTLDTDTIKFLAEDSKMEDHNG